MQEMAKRQKKIIALTSSRCGSRVSEVVQHRVPDGVTRWHRKRNSPVAHRVLKETTVEQS